MVRENRPPSISKRSGGLSVTHGVTHRPRLAVGRFRVTRRLGEEGCVHPRHGDLAGRGNQTGVDVWRRAALAVAEDLGNQPGVGALRPQERGARVPQVVEADLWQPGCLEQPRPRPAEIFVGDRSSAVGALDEPVDFPGRALVAVPQAAGPYEPGALRQPTRAGAGCASTSRSSARRARACRRSAIGPRRRDQFRPVLLASVPPGATGHVRASERSRAGPAAREAWAWQTRRRYARASTYHRQGPTVPHRYRP